MRTPLALAALLVAVPATPSLAGPLAPPPGPIADTQSTLGFKTLQQVEPRIDISTLPFGSASVYRINEPGSYFLASNVTLATPGQSIIEIAADNVTLDLNGFQLDGFGSADSAIRFVNAPTPPENVTIRNGTISRFAGEGIDASTGRNTVVQNVRARDCAIGFFFPDGPTTLTDCIATGCGDTVSGFGQFVVFDGSLTRCTADGGPTGGFNGEDATFTDCVARNHPFPGFGVSRSTLRGCVATDNGDGIQAFNNSTVEDCMAYSNDDDGFQVTGVVRGCTSANNASDGFSLGQGSVIEGCRATANQANGYNGSFYTATECVADNNAGDGFNSGITSIIATRCHAIANTNYGFRAGPNARFNTCQVTFGGAGSASGFLATNHASATDCTVTNTNLGSAFEFGVHATVTRCTVQGAALGGIIVGADSSVSHCNVTGALGTGIGVGAYARVSHCLVENAGTTGINASSHTVMTDCVVTGSGGAGIDADANSVVARCIAENNGTLGIDVDDNSNVTDCVAASNGDVGIIGDIHTSIVACTAVTNTNDGISVDTGSVVRDCTGRSNGVANIRFANDCRITGNHTDGGQYGLITNSSDSTIDSNSLVDASVAGIFINSSGNFITRNTTAGNATNFSIAGGNDFGTIQTSPVGAGPWDNFEF